MNNLHKNNIYKSLKKEAEHLILADDAFISKMANMAALLHDRLGHFWTGFYIVEGDHELILGPFQGPVACTKITKGKGVCGTAWAEMKSQVVPDVHLFPGHIACSAESNSEIVVPIIKNNKVIAVLDIDSIHKNTFDEADRLFLEELMPLLI